MVRFRAPERFAKRGLTSVITRLSPPEKIALEDVQQRCAGGLTYILLIRHHQHRGDLLLATPVFRALRERYPDAHIALVAGESTAEAVAHNPHLSRVHVLRRSIWLHQFNLRTLLRELKTPAPAELCLMLSTEAVSLTGAAVARLSGAHMVVGYDTAAFDPNRREAEAHYNCVIPPAPPDAQLSETDRALGLLTALGIPLGGVAQDKSPIMGVTADDTAWAREMLKNQKRPFIAFHVGGTYREKAWPLRYYAYAHEALYDKLTHTAFAIGGPGEEDTVSRFRTLCHRPPKLMTGMTFGQLAALLHECDFFIGNDTGPLHVAAAVGTPSLGIFLTTDPARWLPHGDHVACVTPTNGDEPTVEQVAGIVAGYFDTGRLPALSFR